MRAKTLKDRLRKAKLALTNFDPRGSNCPICGREFRTDCSHSVVQARELLASRVTFLQLKVTVQNFDLDKETI